MPLVERNIPDSLSAEISSHGAPNASKTSGRNMSYQSAAGTVTQLRIMTDHANRIFDNLASLMSSFDTRIESLSNRVVKEVSDKKNRSSIREDASAVAVDKSLCLSSAASDTPSLLPHLRHARLVSLYYGERMHRAPLLSRLDRLLSENSGEPGPCSKGFSDPSLFFVKWQSQQEVHLEEMQTERSARRGERKKRRVLELKSRDDAKLKRRASDIPKVVEWMKEMNNKKQLQKIDEDDVTDGDGLCSKSNYEGNPINEWGAEGDEARRSVASAIDAMKIRDLLAKNATGMNSPPLKPPKPEKPPRHATFAPDAPAPPPPPPPLPLTDDGEVTSPPPCPPPPPPPPLQPEQEDQPRERPKSLRPKSVKFTRAFLDQQPIQTIANPPPPPPSLATEMTENQSQVTNSPSRLAEQGGSAKDAAPESSRPVSRRLRPQSVDLRRSATRPLSSTHEYATSQKSASISEEAPATVTSPVRLQSPSLIFPALQYDNRSVSPVPVSSDRSSIFTAIRNRGEISLNKVTINDADANRSRMSDSSNSSPLRGEEGRPSLGMLGGSAVSAILARRKYLQDDNNGSDSEKDSEDDWI